MPIEHHPENQRLVAWMQSKQLNASQLAERLGTSRATISHVVNGRNKLSLSLVQALAEAFPDFDLSYIVLGRPATSLGAATSKHPTSSGQGRTLSRTEGLETLIIVQGDHFEIKTRKPIP